MSSTEAPAPTTYLTEEQHARAEALTEARRVLAARTPFGTAAADAIDIHSLAVFILSGGDPWKSAIIESAEEKQPPDAVPLWKRLPTWLSLIPAAVLLVLAVVAAAVIR